MVWSKKWTTARSGRRGDRCPRRDGRKARSGWPTIDSGAMIAPFALATSSHSPASWPILPQSSQSQAPCSRLGDLATGRHSETAQSSINDTPRRPARNQAEVQRRLRFVRASTQCERTCTLVEIQQESVVQEMRESSQPILNSCCIRSCLKTKKEVGGCHYSSGSCIERAWISAITGRAAGSRWITRKR